MSLPAGFSSTKEKNFPKKKAKRSPPSKNQISDEELDLSLPKPVLDAELKVTCIVCESTMSEGSWDLHVIGRKHQKKLTVWKAKRIGRGNDSSNKSNQVSLPAPPLPQKNLLINQIIIIILYQKLRK